MNERSCGVDYRDTLVGSFVVRLETQGGGWEAFVCLFVRLCVCSFMGWSSLLLFSYSSRFLSSLQKTAHGVKQVGIFVALIRFLYSPFSSLSDLFSILYPLHYVCDLIMKIYESN